MSESNPRKRATMPTPKQDAKRGTWYIKFDAPPDPVTGKRRQVTRSGFKTLKAANAAMKKYLHDIEQGTYVTRDDQTLETFLLTQWLPIHARTITASTLSQYRRLIKTHVGPAIGAMKVQDVKATHLNSFYTDLLARGRRDHGRTAASGDGLSPTTVIKIHALLHKAFDAAVKWGVIARNPANDADPPKIRRRPKLNIWSDEQAARFLHDLNLHEDAYTAPLRLALTTGLRRGELLGLAWDDLDLDGHKLTVRAQLLVIDGKVVYSEDTKSHRERTIDLGPETVAVLRRYRVRQQAQRLAVGVGYRNAQFTRSDGTDVHLVFRHEDGAPIHPHPFSMAFKRRAKRAGVPVIRFHDLRHTHISKLVRAGKLKVAQDRAGHANAGFTMQVYASALPTEQAQAACEAENDIDAIRSLWQSG